MAYTISLRNQKCEKIEDIRYHFCFEEVRDYHIDGDLEQWLLQNNYAKMAHAVSSVPDTSEVAMLLYFVDIFFGQDREGGAFILQKYLPGFIQKIGIDEAMIQKAKDPDLSRIVEKWAVATLFVKPDLVVEVKPDPLQFKSKLVEMVKVDGGTFTMGGGAHDDEKPAHQVTVDSFFMSKYPVTQRQWKEVMKGSPSQFVGDNYPVENVNWYDAVKFCNVLSKQEGFDECYLIREKVVTINDEAVGYRLPTEAEWEFAARGGNKKEGFTYSGSNQLSEVAWYDESGGGQTHAVGLKSPNGLGLYDMSGNVWEWCWDWKGTYPSSAQLNPLGATSGSYRVYRGGSWNNSAGSCAVSCRNYDAPVYASGNLGFRLVFASSSK